MWLLPLLTVGFLSVGTFCGGVVTALAMWTDPAAAGHTSDIWAPIFLAALGAVGMWWTVRITPER